MSMTLTTDDLQAIKSIVEDVVEESDQRTAAGFAEVHQKFDEVYGKLDGLQTEVGSIKETVEHIQSVQRAEIMRLDHQESTLKKMRKVFKTI